MAWDATASSFLFLFYLLLLEGQTLPIAYPLTQQQLAQYVAAQQTQQAPQSAVILTPRYVSSAAALSRQRQTYLQEPEQVQQQSYQEEEQPAAQQPLLYYRQQQQRPQLIKKYTGKQLAQDQQKQQPKDYDVSRNNNFNYLKQN